MLLGSHISIAGGLHCALEKARQLGFNTMAMFLRNQRQWRTRPLRDDEAERFRRLRAELKIAPISTASTPTLYCRLSIARRKQPHAHDRGAEWRDLLSGRAADRLSRL